MFPIPGFFNPEPETDTEEPGELDDALTVEPKHANVQTNNIATWPPTVSDYPNEASNSQYIRIPIASGATITIEWEWVLPCEVGNEAQGDTLDFNIHYTQYFPPEEEDDPGNGNGEYDKPPPYNPPDLPGFEPTGKFSQYVTMFEMDPVDISSTEIRKLIRSGDDVRGFLHPEVNMYIKENGIYTENE